MTWKVTIKKTAAKQIAKLPENVRKSLALLMREMDWKGLFEGTGPITEN